MTWGLQRALTLGEKVPFVQSVIWLQPQKHHGQQGSWETHVKDTLKSAFLDWLFRYSFFSSSFL